MRATFIGGTMHAEVLNLADGMTSFKATPKRRSTDPVPLEDTYELYVKKTWHDPKTGDEALMVLSTIPEAEIDAMARPLMRAR